MNSFKLFVAAVAVVLAVSCSSDNKAGVYSFKKSYASQIDSARVLNHLIEYVERQPYFNGQSSYSGGYRDVCSTAADDFKLHCDELEDRAISDSLSSGEFFKIYLTDAVSGKIVACAGWAFGQEGKSFEKSFD